MEYDTLYIVDFEPINWFAFLIPLSLVLIGLYAIKMIRQYGFKHPMQKFGLFPNVNYIWIGKFFAFFFTLFGFILLIGMLVMIPKKILEKKEVMKILQTENYLQVEGYVEKFSPSDSFGTLR
jgi:uncharacterized membrane protein